jgi:hypothetical protein
VLTTAFPFIPYKKNVSMYGEFYLKTMDEDVYEDFEKKHI